MVDTTGRMFKDGAWGDVWGGDLFLVKNGLETSVGGGATGYAIVSSGSVGGFSTYRAPDIVRNPDRLSFTLYRTSADMHLNGSVFFNNRIDLSKYATMEIETARSSRLGYYIASIAVDIRNGFLNKLNDGLLSNLDRKVTKYDISSINTECYVGFELCQPDAYKQLAILDIFNIKFCAV